MESCMSDKDAILRLARQIDAASRAESFRMGADAVGKLRTAGALDLHGICADFVSSVNEKLSAALLELSPATYSPEAFRSSGANLFQISSHGRQMQIAFVAPPQLVSTDKFAIPYVLEGEIRTYNQEMLERFEVRSRLIFLCVEQYGTAWKSFDWRTRNTGPIDRELLASLMEPLF
jgi:hypothetical protein